MKTYTFRPYYAYDCDSEMGFNNGRYLAEIRVEASNSTDARRLAMAALADQFNFESIDADETQCLGVDAAWTHGHVWRRGEEESQAEPEDDDNGDWEVSYLYKYLDLGEPEVT